MNKNSKYLRGKNKESSQKYFQNVRLTYFFDQKICCCLLQILQTVKVFKIREK